MLRHPGLIAACACIVASVGCDGRTGTGPLPTVTVEFSGRVVNADTEDPVGNVRISVDGSPCTGGRIVQRPVEMAHSPFGSRSRLAGWR